MRYRRLGATSLNVSEISLGTGDNAGAVVYGSRKEQTELISRALDLGVNLFDTSPDYGKGLGEVNLGQVLRELRPANCHVITKVEIWPEHFDMIGLRIQESINDSLMRLQRDHVDVLMLHNPVQSVRDLSIRRWARMTQQDVIGEVIPALQKVRESGKARYLGLACESSDPKAVDGLLATGEFAMINAWYNLANPSAETAIGGLSESENYSGLFEVARRHNAGIAVIRPLAGGALTGALISKGHQGRHPLSRGYFRDIPAAFEPELRRGRQFSFLHRPGEQSVSEAAMKYILANSSVTTIVGGFSEISHLEEAVKCSDNPGLSPHDMAAISSTFKSF